MGADHEVGGEACARVVPLLPVAIIELCGTKEFRRPSGGNPVGMPCGGLRSAIALVTLIAALVYVVEGPPIRRLFLLTLAVPIALAANIVRLVILLGIANQWGAAAGLDYFHNWASPVLFLVAFGFVLLAARLLKCDQPAWDLLRL